MGTSPFTVYADSDVFDSTNYTLVDYVSPNGGSAYIDTGYLPKSTTSIKSTFSYTAITSGRRFYGANDSSNQYGLGISSSNYYVVRYTSGTTTKNTDGKFPVDTVVTFNQTPTVTTATDGTTTYTTSTYSQSNNITKSLYIFSSNTTSGSQNQYPTLRLYNFEIYENSVLVHHYYPCFRKSDNVVGIYDGVDRSFISPSVGTLSYGSIATTQYTIATRVSPENSGTVTGGGTYDSGSVVTLTAIPNTGYHFVSWGDGSTDNPRTITVNSNQMFTASFVQDSSPSQTYTISTSVSPVGSGSVTGGGTYNENTVVSLSATPNTGYTFVRWSDNVTSQTRSITVTSDLSLTAYFEQVVTPVQTYTISTSVSPTDSGTVTGGGTYESGTVVTLTAVPNSGYVFGSWSDGSIVNPRQVEVTSNASYSAIFTQDLSNTIVLGANLSIIDYERQYIITSYSGTLSGSGSLYFSQNSTELNVYSLYEIEFILNNDYIGKIIVNVSLSGENIGTGYTLTKSVYINGNTFKFNVGPYSNSSVTIRSVTYDTSQLSLKESTVNALYNGTTESNQSSQNLDDVTSDYSEVSNQAINVENQLGQGFSDSMQNVPTNFNFGTQFGNKFLTSATWVRTQFDRMTANNPFGALITYSLILGLALLLVGKRLL